MGEPGNKDIRQCGEPYKATPSSSGGKLFSGEAGRCPSSHFLLRALCSHVCSQTRLGSRFSSYSKQASGTFDPSCLWEEGTFFFFLFKMWLLFDIQNIDPEAADVPGLTQDLGVLGGGDHCPGSQRLGSSRKRCPELGTQRGVQ